MAGYPRYSIHVPALEFQLAHTQARQAGFHTTSDWLRALLWSWDDEPLEPRARRTKTLSVRLSPPLQARLAHIAAVSEMSLSEAFSHLVERALLTESDNENDVEPPQRTAVHERVSAATSGTQPAQEPAARTSPVTRSVQKRASPASSMARSQRTAAQERASRASSGARPDKGRASPATSVTRPAQGRASPATSVTRPAPRPCARSDVPAPDDYEQWSEAIHDAARATPHKFGRNRAFIAGVLEELFERFQADDPDAFCAMVRALLPELNRLDLVRLSRADLVAEMDPELVRDSATRYLNATFHFVNLD